MNSNHIPQSLEPEGIFAGLKPGAIIAGVIADVACTFISGIVLTMILFSSIYGSDIPDDAAETLFKVQNVQYLFLALGISCTVFGGYIGARLAGTHNIRHGGWVGAVSLVISVVMELNSESQMPWPQWFIYTSMAATIPAGVLGGYIWGQFSNADKTA